MKARGLNYPIDIEHPKLLHLLYFPGRETWRPADAAVPA